MKCLAIADLFINAAMMESVSTCASVESITMIGIEVWLCSASS